MSIDESVKREQFARTAHVVLEVLKDNFGEELNHSALKDRVKDKFKEEGREESTCLNQAIGYLLDEKWIIRNSLGTGIKYRITRGV